MNAVLTIRAEDMSVTNPVLADRILHFLLSEEAVAHPAGVLSEKLGVPVDEIEYQINAINEIRPRWIYEFPRHSGEVSYYIIGNCRRHIREHLRKGGFQNVQDNPVWIMPVMNGNDFIRLAQIKEYMTSSSGRKVSIAILAIILLVVVVSACYYYIR